MHDAQEVRGPGGPLNGYGCVPAEKGPHGKGTGAGPLWVCMEGIRQAAPQILIRLHLSLCQFMVPGGAQRSRLRGSQRAKENAFAETLNDKTEKSKIK